MSRQEQVHALVLEMAASLGVQKGAQAESAITSLYPWAAALVDAETALQRGNKSLKKALRERKRAARQVAKIHSTIDALAHSQGSGLHPTAHRLEPWAPPRPRTIPAANGSGVSDE